MKSCLKKWSEGDFKKDPQLNLIPSLYQKMKSEGHEFVDYEKSDPTAMKREPVLSKDPNVVSSQQEEDDIAKAIELSLKEAKTASPKLSSSVNAASTTTSLAASASLYPSVSLNSGFSAISAPVPEPRKVRALYDFEAAEENELTFFTGEIIMVLEDSDANWWKGQNHRGEGLFPANFVTADLSVDPEFEPTKIKKSVQFDEQSQDASISNESQKINEINEGNIDRLLLLLHDADPEDPSQDTDEMLRLENEVNQMGPLIDAELERVDRKHAQLTQLSGDLVDAINLYHTLMRQPEVIGGGPMMMPGGFGVPHSMPPTIMYSLPANMYQMSNPMMSPQSQAGPSPQHQQTPSQQQPSQQGMPHPNFMPNMNMPPGGMIGQIRNVPKNGPHNIPHSNMNPIGNIQQTPVSQQQAPPPQHMQQHNHQQQMQQPQQQMPQMIGVPQQQQSPLGVPQQLPQQMQSSQPGLPSINNYMPNPNMQQQLQNPNFSQPNSMINSIPSSVAQITNISMHHQLPQQQHFGTNANPIMGMSSNTLLHQQQSQPQQHPHNILQSNSNTNIPIYQQQR